jgi:hypothetical protein
MRSIQTIGTFEYHLVQLKLFRSGILWRKWQSNYADIFDQDDLHLARSQARLGYHFHEWLAAIMIFHSTGYLSLVEKYQFDNHKRKKQVLEKLGSDDLYRAIRHKPNDKNAQCPDLLVYSGDFKDWYFCEVKGNKDKVSKGQENYFKALFEITGRPVRLIRLLRARI